MSKNYFSKVRLLHALITAAVVMVVVVLLSPTLLIFSESKDGSITIWNFVGIAYLLLIFWLSTKVNGHFKSNSDDGRKG